MGKKPSEGKKVQYSSKYAITALPEKFSGKNHG